MLLAEKIVELGEDGDVVCCSENSVEVEFGVAEVEVAVRQEKVVEIEGSSAGASVVQLEGRVVAAAAEGAFEGGGETVGGVFGCEEAGVGRALEGAASYEWRKGANGNAGKVRVGDG